MQQTSVLPTHPQFLKEGRDGEPNPEIYEYKKASQWRNTDLSGQQSLIKAENSTSELRCTLQHVKISVLSAETTAALLGTLLMSVQKCSTELLCHRHTHTPVNLTYKHSAH